MLTLCVGEIAFNDTKFILNIIVNRQYLPLKCHKTLSNILHNQSLNCPSSYQPGLFATGEIRQNIKFAAFWCVLLTKIKVGPESC